MISSRSIWSIKLVSQVCRSNTILHILRNFAHFAQFCTILHNSAHFAQFCTIPHILHNFAHFAIFCTFCTILQILHNFAQFCTFCIILHILHNFSHCGCWLYCASSSRFCSARPLCGAPVCWGLLLGKLILDPLIVAICICTPVALVLQSLSFLENPMGC